MDPLREQLLLIHSDIKDIKSVQLEQVKQGAIHNTVLIEHQKRSMQLEERFRPVEDDLKFRAKIMTVCLGGGGLLAALATLLGMIYSISKLLGR